MPAQMLQPGAWCMQESLSPCGDPRQLAATRTSLFSRHRERVLCEPGPLDLAQALEPPPCEEPLLRVPAVLLHHLLLISHLIQDEAQVHTGGHVHLHIDVAVPLGAGPGAELVFNQGHPGEEPWDLEQTERQAHELATPQSARQVETLYVSRQGLWYQQPP